MMKQTIATTTKTRTINFTGLNIISQQQKKHCDENRASNNDQKQHFEEPITAKYTTTSTEFYCKNIQ